MSHISAVFDQNSSAGFSRRILPRFARSLSAAAGMAVLLGLAGCANDPFDARKGLSARLSDPDGLVSGLPARGEEVCLITSGRHSQSLDVVLRSALVDRGYRVVMLKPGEEPNAKVCRFAVAIHADRGANFAQLPQTLSLDYRDFYTGEAQRAGWKRPAAAAEARQGFLHAASSESNRVSGVENVFLTPSCGDPDSVIRNLVDRLFPMPNRSKE